MPTIYTADFCNLWIPTHTAQFIRAWSAYYGFWEHVKQQLSEHPAMCTPEILDALLFKVTTEGLEPDLQILVDIGDLKDKALRDVGVVHPNSMEHCFADWHEAFSKRYLKLHQASKIVPQLDLWGWSKLNFTFSKAACPEPRHSTFSPGWMVMLMAADSWPPQRRAVCNAAEPENTSSLLIAEIEIIMNPKIRQSA